MVVNIKHTASRSIFWLVLVAMLLLAANMRAPIVAFGSVALVVQQALNVDPIFIGWVGSAPMLMFAIGALVSPKIGRKVGLENTLIVALVVLTIGILLRSWWAGQFGFLAGTLLLSFAIGFANTLAPPIIKQRTPQHITLITGLFTLSMTLFAGLAAGVVYPLANHVGWQWSLGGWAVLGVVGLVFWVYMRLRIGSSHHLLVHQLKDGDLKETDFQKAAPKEMAFVKEAGDEIKTNTKLDFKDSTDTSIWRTGLAWQMAVFMGLQSLLFYTVASFLPAICVSKGLSQTQAGVMASVFQFAAPVTIVGLTWLIGRGVSIQKITVVSSICNVLGVLGMLYLPAKLTWLWTASMGAGCAAIFSICMMLFSLRTYTSYQSSKLSGMAQAVGYMVAFFGPLATGWLTDTTGNWYMAELFLLTMMVINTIVGWYTSRPIMIDGQPVNA